MKKQQMKENDKHLHCPRWKNPIVMFHIKRSASVRNEKQTRIRLI
jgi:hypothetical protein